jgi:hypothetical protein
VGDPGVIRDVERLITDLRDLRQRVEQMDRSGASVTQVEIREIKKDIDAINTAITGMVEARREESQWTRRMMLTALFGAAVALGLWFVQFLIDKAHP